MAVEINLNTDVLRKRISETAEGAAMITLEGMLKDIDPYVPYDTGELSSSAIIDESSLSIVWDTEYADYVYNMPKTNNFNTSVHANATSHWVDEAMNAYREKWVEDLRSNFRKRWGG